MIRIFSDGIRRIPHLDAFLKEEVQKYAASEAVVGWGHKPTADKARAYAKAKHLPYIAAEDGFLRSLDLGVNGAPPLSLTVDPIGVYYDASAPSQIENDINDAPNWMTPTWRHRAQQLMDRLVEKDLSKYNAAPSVPPGWLDARYPDCVGRRKVLLIDQTKGDASVRLGLADETSFAAMVEAARAENPGAAFFVKTHPDVAAGKKAGYLPTVPGMAVLSDVAAPLSFLKEFDAVYAVTSQMGFEAVLVGKPVTLFGVPFYAGWGLTDDRGSVPERRKTCADAAAVFAAAYIRGARYVNPMTGERIEIEEAIDILETQKRANDAHRGTVICAGVRRWKKTHFRAFLAGTDTQLKFIWDWKAALKAAQTQKVPLAIWAAKCTDKETAEAEAAGVPLIRVEDGFIRSIGLGSDYETPYSLVTDMRGIYYDPAKPSDLEVILNDIARRPEHYQREMTRARGLIQTITEHHITKYNLPVPTVAVRKPTAGRDVVLVIGQVDGDASVRRGGGAIQTNAALLQEVRRRRPVAYIIYLEHPDVASGNRPGVVGRDELKHWADDVVSGVPAFAFFGKVREIHTLTSLTGFEALLRGIRVVTYGRPFYAGWGLTQDALTFENRCPCLTLEGLVAGTLILYPTYWDWKTGMTARPEEICRRIVAGEQPVLPLWVRFVRKIRNLRRKFLK